MSIRVLRFASLGQLMVFQLALTFAQAAEYEPRPAGYQGYGSNDSSGPSTPSGTAQANGYGNQPQPQTMAQPLEARPMTTGVQGTPGYPYDRVATTSGRPSAPARAQNAPPAKTDGEAEASEADRANAPPVAQALKLTPVQKGVDISTPAPEAVSQCKIYARRIGNGMGWIVEDPNGLILRKFIDTNGDNKLDQWCYFKDGLEVYRDIDSDFDGKADQYRWFNTGGSRWGVDKNEDGVIDYWQAISPEEVTSEVVAAMATQDVARFARVLLKADELASLGLGAAKAQALAEKIRLAPGKFRDLIGQQTGITEKTKWNHFSGNQPGIVPAGTEGSTRDIQVYENVLAIVQLGSDHGQVQIGTMVKVGDGWRVIDTPQVVPDGRSLASAGFFFLASQSAVSQVAAGAPSEKSQEAMGELEKLDAAASRASLPEEIARINTRRADLMEKMADEATKPEERAMWLRQLADMIGAAVQTGGFPDGDKRLQALFEKVQKNDQDRPLAGRVRWAQLTAAYGLAVQGKGVDFSKIQAEWLKRLEQYVNEYPRSPDAAEAMLQLGLAQEFAGQDEEAKKWYGQITSDFAESPQAKKAAGARLRLSSVGKILSFQGRGISGEIIDLAKYRGQVVLIQYWNTTCEPCKADMAVLKDLLGKHGRNFAVVGINLDQNARDVAAFLKENGLPWPQIYEPGGMESRPALEMGILTLPTMLLLDQNGKVVSRNIGTTELEGELKRLIR